MKLIKGAFTVLGELLFIMFGQSRCAYVSICLLYKAYTDSKN